jgi:hypothetical protein
MPPRSNRRGPGRGGIRIQTRSTASGSAAIRALMPAVSMGRRNTSVTQGGCDGARLSEVVAGAMDEVWVRLRAGHAAKPTARQLGLSTSTVRAYLLRCGGIRPDPRCRSPRRLSVAEREEISRGLAAGMSLRAIAVQSGRAASTISREVAVNGGRSRYRASRADQMA